jgi:hypothetical protein
MIKFVMLATGCVNILITKLYFKCKRKKFKTVNFPE